MPYKIVQEHKGCFKVSDPKHPSRMFSKRCQTKTQAQKQRIAIALSESVRSHKPISSFFA